MTHHKSTDQELHENWLDWRNNLTREAESLLAALRATDNLIVMAQGILTRQLIPDGLTPQEALNELYGLLDGPHQREIQRNNVKLFDEIGIEP